MATELRIEGTEVSGEIALAIPPGTVAAKRDAMLDEHLTDMLFDAAAKLGVVLAADPHDFARALDGRDEQGRARFVVQGRVEGDRLLPVDGRKPKSTRR